KEVLSKMIDYLGRRVSTKVKFQLDAEEADIHAFINESLFGWVVENLIKNAVDAMEGNGLLNLYIHRQDHRVWLDISDTGKGMTKSERKQIFRPGYTTKSRGWGLGLTLV